jgi:hypothetical protein
MRPLLAVGSAASNKVGFAPAGSKMVDADANRALRDIEIAAARYCIKFLHAILLGYSEAMHGFASAPRTFWFRKTQPRNLQAGLSQHRC